MCAERVCLCTESERGADGERNHYKIITAAANSVYYLLALSLKLAERGILDHRTFCIERSKENQENSDNTKLFIKRTEHEQRRIMSAPMPTILTLLLIVAFISTGLSRKLPKFSANFKSEFKGKYAFVTGGKPLPSPTHTPASQTLRFFKVAGDLSRLASPSRLAFKYTSSAFRALRGAAQYAFADLVGRCARRLDQL